MELLKFSENGMNVVFEVDDEGYLKLLHISNEPFCEELIEQYAKKWFSCFEFQVTGKNQNDHHGAKHTGTSPASDLKYFKYNEYKNNYGQKLEMICGNEEFIVICHYQFFNGIGAIRAWTQVENISNAEQGIEYISSFKLVGFDKEGDGNWQDKIKVQIPHNTWYGEVMWHSYNLYELGLSKVFSFTTNRISIHNTGTWSTNEYLPVGYIENTKSNQHIMFQIENNGSWQWEIGDITDHLYLQLSGPTENENHWWKSLKPNEQFITVPICIAFSNQGFDDVIGIMTQYRRAIRRPNEDNVNLPIIFNDYMNCLFGDPTTEKLIPLIDAAFKAGCEYFCIDAGWYSDGFWWDSVGEWLPSKSRFPNGVEEVIQYIKSKGMVAGLWLELEVMGINCPMTSKVSKDWFFCRHGKPIIDHSRYQLDFRNPQVASFAHSVIDRLVSEYGVGYIKMDYNINAGCGTELKADSFGDGLLQHNRAYLKWLDDVFVKYPNLVVENCGSGGLRMDYALLSRHSIQSTSDQTDYKKYATIAAAAPTVVTPEQAAVWSYPLKDANEKETVFNMVNAMLLRIHQSGHLAQVNNKCFDKIKEGLDFYKKIRNYIPISTPFWPIGLPKTESEFLCLGLQSEDKIFVAIWRLASKKSTINIKINILNSSEFEIKLSYPNEALKIATFNKENSILTIKLKNKYSACVFEMDKK
jgi:alpha-galactosidase